MGTKTGGGNRRGTVGGYLHRRSRFFDREEPARSRFLKVPGPTPGRTRVRSGVLKRHDQGRSRSIRLAFPGPPIVGGFSCTATTINHHQRR